MCRADDVQVEFIMLDPYQRITLKHNNEVCSSPGSVFGSAHWTSLGSQDLVKIKGTEGSACACRVTISRPSGCPTPMASTNSWSATTDLATQPWMWSRGYDLRFAPCLLELQPLQFLNVRCRTLIMHHVCGQCQR